MIENQQTRHVQPGSDQQERERESACDMLACIQPPST